MSDQHIDDVNETSEKKSDSQDLGQKLSAVGWGLFFLWVGIAVLSKITFDIALIGVGSIILVMQAIRKVCNLKIEIFWVVVGILFVVLNIFELPEINIPIIPILLIVVGVFYIFSVFKGKKQSDTSSDENPN